MIGVAKIWNGTEWVSVGAGTSDHTLLSNIGTLTHAQLEASLSGKLDAPVAPAANPDTTGATLASLETEVNELKAALRTAKIIGT